MAVGITGTGFDPVPGNNDVFFIPAAGAPIGAPGFAIALVNQTTGARRVTVRVPAGLPIGPTALRVVNRTTGEVSEGRSLNVIQLSIAGTSSAFRGSTDVAVRIIGSPNTHFTASNIRVVFGAGVTVQSTAVESPTSLVATIAVAASAALGPRDITVISTETGLISGAFTIVEPPPPNRPPVARPGEAYSGTMGQPVSFDASASTDPDTGDSIVNYAWAFGDGATAAGASVSHTYGAAGTFTASLTVRDSHGAEHTATTPVTIVAANRPPASVPGGPYSGTAGENVAFDATQSTDDDGDPLTFAWSFGDGETAEGATALHAYTNPGNYVGALTVSDGRGGSHTQTFTVQIAAASLGRGILTGRVIDDATGAPIAGALVHLLNSDGSQADVLPVTTDALGRYRLSTPPGSVRVRVVKDGFTMADLAGVVADERRTDPDDARLTALGSSVVASSVAGGNATTTLGARLVVPPGAAAEDLSLRVTDISRNGAIRRLPLGWVSVAGIDIRGVGQLSAPATLEARVPASVAAEREVIVVQWSVEAGAWIAMNVATAGSDPSTVASTISSGGQYLFAIADLPPDAPPAPAIGSALTGVAPRPPPQIQLTLNPAPRVLFAQPGARAAVTAVAVPAEPLPSGTPLRVDLAESLTFASGATLAPWPERRRLSLYRDSGHTLSATFTVAPSRPLAPFALRQGAIDLAGRVPLDPSLPFGRVFGPNGGQFSTAAGERVIVPAAASADDLPIDIFPISAAAMPIDLPSVSTFVGAVGLDLHGAVLTQPVRLAVPFAGPLPDGVLAVVQLADIGDATRFVLVASATVADGTLITTTDPFGDGSIVLPGVRSEGRYAFLKLNGAFGYVAGGINAGGGAVPGAFVTTDAGIGALANAAGDYVLLAAVGQTTVRVANPANGDETAINVDVVANAVATREVSIGPSPPFILAMSPAAGAVNVPLGSGITVTFSEPIDPATLAGAVSLAAGGTIVAGAVSLAPDGSRLTFLPAGLLQSDTSYQLVVAPTVRDLAGHAMIAGFAGSFRTVDVTPPPLPGAGAIVASIPDAAGNSILTGAAGTADPAGMVIVVNRRTNARTTLTPNADGSFSGVVAARRTDQLELTICDGAVRPNQEENICGTGHGNATTMPLPAFRGADGSVVVGSAGGRVEGAGGAIADIPPGALPDGTVVRVEAIGADAFPAAAPALSPFAGGIRLDLGGVRAQREIDLSIAAPPGAGPLDQVVVAHTVPHRGGQAWTVIERAHFASGRYQTASPPFIGAVFQGSYAFLRFDPNNPLTGCVSYVSVSYEFGLAYTITPTGFPFVYPALDSSVVTFPASCSAQVDVTVNDPDTNEVIQQITYVAPSARDDIAFPPDLLTDDHSRPTIVSLNNPTGAEVERIELRFSKRLNADSVAIAFRVRDEDGAEVAGSIEMADQDSVIIFRPNQPFRLGERYTILVFGITDLANNLVDSEPITFTPFGPRTLRQLRNVGALVPHLERCSTSGGCTTSALDVAYIGKTLFLANGVRRAEEQYSDPAQPRKLLAIDVTDPFNPSLIGWHETTTNPRVLATVENTSFFTGSEIFAGDLLLVGGGGRDSTGERHGKLEIYDVTACEQRPVLPNMNCLADGLRGVKFLSTPAGLPPLTGVPPDPGIPLQIATLHQPGVSPTGDTLLAYVLTVPIGIEAIDVTAAFNYPLVPGANDRGPDGLLRGDYLDVAVLKNRVMAVGIDPASAQPRLSLLTAQLASLLTVPPPPPPGLTGFAGAARLGVGANIVYDIDGDGRLGTAEEDDEDSATARSEIFDLAIVATGSLTTGCTNVTPCGELYVIDMSPESVDLDHEGGVRVLERIPMPGAPFSVQVDVAERQAYVELRGRGLAIVDLHHLLAVLRGTVGVQGLLDTNADGVDDRIVSILPTGSSQGDIVVARIKVDFKRGVAFVNGGATGVEIVQVANKGNELALDFRQPPAAPVGDRNTALRTERTLLLDLINDAMTRLAEPVEAGGIGVPEDQMAALEQGSGSCFWRAPFDEPGDGPSRSCRSFQPGTSDHDIEIFVPQPRVALAQRILNALLNERRDDVEELGDVSLYAMPIEPFENTELLVGTPLYGAGVSDATGDLGKGRELLLLLWLLEGEYVYGYEGRFTLDELLRDFRNKEPLDMTSGVAQPSAIPTLDGFEWSVLQEYNANKTGARLRVVGACNGEGVQASHYAELDDLRDDPLRNFNEAGFHGAECADEIHSVAKAAIRAVLARLAADRDANPLITAIHPDLPDDSLSARASYRSNACLQGPFTSSNLNLYQPVPCDSFEHYIASVAVRSVAAGADVFEDHDLPRIFDFYCAKVDCRPVVTNDQQADAFVFDAFKFIEESQLPEHTRDEYARTVMLDTEAIGEIPLLHEGPDGTPGGIAQICERNLAQHANLIDDFLPAGTQIPADIDHQTPRAWLRLCNYIIVTLKVDGDPAAPVEDDALLADHIQRDHADLAAVKRRLGVKNYVDWKLKVRALNLGANPVLVNLALFDGNGDDVEDYELLPVLPPDLTPLPDDLSLLPVGLEPGEARVISEGQTAGGGEAALYPLLFNLTRPELHVGLARTLVFVLDPENTVPEANKHDNQAPLVYYVLDVDGPQTQPPPPPPLPPPVSPVDDIDPDPVLFQPPRLQFDLTVRRAGEGAAYGGKLVTAGLYEDVQVKYRLQNLGTKRLKNVTVSRDGRFVVQIPELAPNGQPGDFALFTDPTPFVPTVPGLTVVRGVAGAFDESGNALLPVPDAASIHASEGVQAFRVGLFDASRLFDVNHPFNRIPANHDDQGHERDLRGAVTDGDDNGGGARIRIEIDRLQPFQEATVAIVDGDLAGDVTDHIGWLDAGENQTRVLSATVEADSSGHAVLHYSPPSMFVRPDHRADDLQKIERTVRLRVVQAGPEIAVSGSTTRRIVLRRPPVFLVHGLFSYRHTWNQLQPLVPPEGVGPHFKPVKGFDGRFDVFAVGSPAASAPFAREAEALKEQIGLSLSGYLEGFSIGKVDVVGHSMGALLIRRIANEFIGANESGAPPLTPERLPFRKLVAIDTPFNGSQLASKMVELRESLPIDLELSVPTDLLDLLGSVDDDTSRITPEIEAKAELEVCALMVQTLGLTPGLFMGGAVNDLAFGSVELERLRTAGTRLPSHHIASAMTDDSGGGLVDYVTIGASAALRQLGVGLEIQSMWATLGYMCGLTPDETTVEATRHVQHTADAVLALVPGLKGLGLPSYSRSLGKLPWAKVSEGTKTVLTRLTPAVKMAAEEAQGDNAPTPLFTFANDRIVEQGSQRGGLDVNSFAATSIDGAVDHTEVLESPGVPLSACGDLVRPGAPLVDDLNGDGTPDISCLLIHLLEAPPEAPLFHVTP